MPADLSTLANSDDLQLINRTYAEMLTVHVVHVNRVGVEDGITFFGGSSVTTPIRTGTANSSRRIR